MNVPRKVRVSPFSFDVLEVHGLADAGSCRPDVESVLLAMDQAPGQKRDTLLHESLHAIVRQGFGSTFEAVDKAFEEQVVSFFAPRILALLRDNPRLVAYLTERV